MAITSPVSRADVSRSRSMGGKDMGSPATTGHNGGPLHRGAPHAGQRLAMGSPAVRTPHDHRCPGRGAGCRSGQTTAPNARCQQFCSSRASFVSVSPTGRSYTPRWPSTPTRTEGWDGPARPARESALYAERSAILPNSDLTRETRCWVTLLSAATRFATRIEPDQCTSVRFGETLALSGLVASSGTVGDGFGNAMAETTIGLYKTEAVRDDSPFRRAPLHRLTGIELVTAEWVHGYNTDRPMHRLHRFNPIDYEAMHYAATAGRTPVTGVHQTRSA